VPAEQPSVDPAVYRHVMSRLPTGVSVVSTSYDGVGHGMTVNAIASVSLDPVLLLFCCERDASLHEPLMASGLWAVSVLSAAQEDASRWFATRERRGTDQFAKRQCREGAHTGAPILMDSVAWFECRTWATYDGGDHTIVVGEVLDMAIEHDTEPLIYFKSDYTRPTTR